MNPKVTSTTGRAAFLAGALSLVILIVPFSAAAREAAQSKSDPGADPAQQGVNQAEQDSMTLKGDEKTTVLRSLTVEGEDKIQIQFDRPKLDLEIDGYAIEGLSWGSALDVVQRREVDLLTPLMNTSTADRAQSLAHPWLRQFREGSVARFHPALDDVASWQLIIADSKGDTVRVFKGKGSLPKEISWDGVYDSGELALPGLVYSYVLTAKDKAGNRRNFVGEGFQVSPYRIATEHAFRLVFSGKSLMGPGVAQRPAGVDDPWLVEAASWLNQYAGVKEPIEIHVFARSHEIAEAMGAVVQEQLARHLAGSPIRLKIMTQARSEAPPEGAVTIAVKS
jgi:hypothetical protein